LKDNHAIAHGPLGVIGPPPLLYSQQRQLTACYKERKKTTKEGRMMAVAWGRGGGGEGVDSSLTKGHMFGSFLPFYMLHFMNYLVIKKMLK
jgi:hypothetical protein